MNIKRYKDNTMKKFYSLVIGIALMAQQTQAEQKTVYVNENLGFNVPNYNYTQSEFPCDLDKHLVQFLVEDGEKLGLNIVPVKTLKEINNGTIPVLAMDVEKLVLNRDHRFGDKSDHPLPKVQVTAAVIQGQDMNTAKHTCAIATLNEFTPASNVMDLGTNITVCGATKRCLKDLSKDIIQWVQPQIAP